MSIFCFNDRNANDASVSSCGSLLCAVMVVLAVLLLAGSAQGLAPLSPQDKLRYATHVFTGTIVGPAVEHRSERLSSTYENMHFRCRVQVDAVWRSMCRGAEAHVCRVVTSGATVQVYWWQAVRRPVGFRGALGLSLPPLPPFLAGEEAEDGNRGVVGPILVGSNYSFAGHFLAHDALGRGMYHATFPVNGEGRTDPSSPAIIKEEQVDTWPEFIMVMPNGIDRPDLFAPVAEESDEL